MPDALALGFGTVTGTRANPNTLLSSASLPSRANFVQLHNGDATNWLFARAATHSLYTVILPGESGVIAASNPSGNGVAKIEGFAATPSEAAAGTITLAVVSGYKVA